MPELTECVAHGLLALNFFEREQVHQSWKLKNLWVDATKSERPRTPPGSPARSGKVYTLTACSPIKRGCTGAQTGVWPPMWRKFPSDREEPTSITTLELHGIEYTYRALILNLGALWLQVQYLTHTSVQWYSITQWKESICNVDLKTRGFKIGLALEFEDYVLAFPTLDLVFQPVWVNQRDELTLRSPDAYTQYDMFVACVSQWILDRATSSQTQRFGLACDAVRNAEDVWGGVGVYTVCELFFIAGVSPLLTEAEVFDNPSRTARLCEALYVYAARAREEVWDLLKPCIHDGILAPTDDQRMEYSRWLHVFGKLRTKMSPSMIRLLDSYVARLAEFEDTPNKTWNRSDTTDLYDVFDPAYITSGMEKPGHLSHLVFGTSSGLPGMVPTDPLTQMFKTRQLLESPTFLWPLAGCEWRHDQGRTVAAHDGWRPTYTYHGAKQIWCIMPNFPENSAPGLPTRNALEVRAITSIELDTLSDQERRKLTFRHVIYVSREVVVGPLEYCGNGRIVKKSGGGGKVLSLCRADPSLSPYYAEREMRGISRRGFALDQPGKAKGRMTAHQRAAVPNLRQRDSENVAVPPRKKRRIGADQRLILESLSIQ
ncbi:hypothetical protein B0H21DRAFT_821093 [Amylocystis lapponica]|nr:hypothetical protein B0H21DRAFT_821093 [Amylocystis lapponica]